MKPFSMLISIVVLGSTVRATPWPKSSAATDYSESAKEPYKVSGGTTEHPFQAQGVETTLDIDQSVARMPQHDVDLGVTRLTLRSKDGQKVLLKETLSELWNCLAFDQSARKYVLASKNEHGVTITLRGLIYLDEAQRQFEDTLFERQSWEAVASLLSSDGHYLAFIGQRDSPNGYIGKEQLVVYNLSADKIVTLGKPPEPPPLSADDVNVAKENQESMEELWRWDGDERGYEDIEPSVMSFTDAHTLRVAYGRDTWKKRAERRTAKSWDLTPLFR